jgi:DNA-binding GntR family transcriptional regulator
MIAKSARALELPRRAFTGTTGYFPTTFPTSRMSLCERVTTRSRKESSEGFSIFNLFANEDRRDGISKFYASSFTSRCKEISEKYLKNILTASACVPMIDRIAIGRYKKSMSRIEVFEGVRPELRELLTSLNNHPTVPGKVARTLRSLILVGKLKPGDCIVERKLARELGIGQPTAREALNRLEAEGLIVRRRNAGCYVTDVSEEECDQIFKLRRILECFAAESLAENWPNWTADGLLQAVETMKKQAKARDAEGFYHTDLEFHKLLWGLTGNPFLVKILTQISVPLFAFVMIKVVAHPEFDLKAAAVAHENIAQAILSGDKELAKSTTLLEFDRLQKMGTLLFNQSE